MPKWDMLLVGAALAGGAILIENRHRIDTGTPDDDIVASVPADCTVVYAVNRERMRPADDRALREEAASALPADCADR